MIWKEFKDLLIFKKNKSLEVNNGNKSECMKKKVKIIQKWWIYYYEMSTLKHFSFNKPSSDGEKCCLNSDGYFIKITKREKVYIQRKNS